MRNFSFFKKKEPEKFSLSSIAGDSVHSTVLNWLEKRARLVYHTEIPLIILTVVSGSTDVRWQHAALRKLGFNLPEPNPESNERPIRRQRCLQGWKRIIGIFLKSNLQRLLNLLQGMATARTLRSKKERYECPQCDRQDHNIQPHDFELRHSISTCSGQLAIEDQTLKLAQFAQFLYSWQIELKTLASENTLLGTDNEIKEKVAAVYQRLYENNSNEIYNPPISDIFAFSPKTLPPRLIAPLDSSFYDSILLLIQSVLIAEGLERPPLDGPTLEISLFQENSKVKNFFRVMSYYAIAYFAQYLITQLWSALLGGDSVFKDPKSVRQIGECIGVLKQSTSRIKSEIDSTYGEELQALLRGVLSHLCESKCENNIWRFHHNGVFGIFDYFELLLKYLPDNEPNMTNKVC